MSMKKIQDILLETTAKYQEKSKLNVRFWRQDLNTAELRFIITRDNFPLSLSSENVKVIIALENGENFISSEDFIIDTEVDGVARFAIPNDFMSVANGTVTGQVYVGTLDNDEVVVERQFTFEVENDLLSTIPSELKLQYIKTFSDLQNNVADSIRDLQEDMATLGDYVDNVNQATQDGLTAINNLVNSKLVEYNDNHADKLALIDSTVGDYVQDFLDQRTYIDTQYNDFKDQLLQSDVIVESNTANWQKYKMTNDDGSRIYLTKGSFADVNALEPGLYETVSNDTPTQGFPTQFANAAFIEIDITKSGSGRKQIQVTQSSRPQTFVKYIHTDGVDNGWKEVAIVNSVTDLETVTNSTNKANTAENNAKQYTDDKVNATRAVLFSGSVSGVNANINLTENMNNYSVLIINGTYTGGTFTEVVLTAGIGSGIPVQRVNLSNTTGGSPNVYEMELSVSSNTRFSILRDNQYSILADNATMNANNFTVKRIEAIK